MSFDSANMKYMPAAEIERPVEQSDSPSTTASETTNRMRYRGMFVSESRISELAEKRDSMMSQGLQKLQKEHDEWVSVNKERALKGKKFLGRLPLVRMQKLNLTEEEVLASIAVPEGYVVPVKPKVIKVKEGRGRPQIHAKSWNETRNEKRAAARIVRKAEKEARIAKEKEEKAQAKLQKKLERETAKVEQKRRLKLYNQVMREEKRLQKELSRDIFNIVPEQSIVPANFDFSQEL